MIFNYILHSSKEIEDYFLNQFNPDNINIDEINLQRTHAFKIQAFGRIIKRSVKKSKLDNQESKLTRELGENLKLSGKFIEDSIGAYLYHYEMKDFAKDSSLLNKAKKTLIEDTKKIPIHTEKIKISFNELNSLSKDLKKIYLKGFKCELKKIKEDIKNIDPNLLEDGTHELRRKLRWVIMYVIYPKGLFKYIEENPDVTKYTKLYPVKGFDAVDISFEVMHFLSESVFALGKVKDEGLAKNYLKPHKNINDSSPEIIHLTKEVISKLFKNRYLKKIKLEISQA